MSPPNPPRTSMADIIREEVTRATEALRRDLEDAERHIQDLQGVDAKTSERLAGLSGKHRLALDTIDKFAETTNADLLRASTHLAGEIESLKSDANAKLGFLYAEVQKLKHVPAQSRATELAVVETRESVDKEQSAARLRFLAVIIPVVLTSITTILAMVVQAFH